MAPASLFAPTQELKGKEQPSPFGQESSSTLLKREVDGQAGFQEGRKLSRNEKLDVVSRIGQGNVMVEFDLYHATCGFAVDRSSIDVFALASQADFNHMSPPRLEALRARGPCDSRTFEYSMLEQLDYGTFRGNSLAAVANSSMSVLPAIAT